MRMANKHQENRNLPTEDTTTAHSWAEVEGELQSAYPALGGFVTRDKDLSGSMGKLQRAFRDHAKHNKTRETLVSLVPKMRSVWFVAYMYSQWRFKGISPVSPRRRCIGRKSTKIWRNRALTDHAVRVTFRWTAAATNCLDELRLCTSSS